MMDPPRHACRGRPMVCPGPCNPLKAHHHHHHHRRHHRQKPDVTGIAATGKDTPLPDEYTQMTLLRSLKTDASVTSVTSTDDTSISRTSSSSTRIAVIRIPKTARAKRTDVPAIIQQILSPGISEMLGEPRRTEETREPAPLRKIESPIPTRTTPTAGETVARTPTYPARRNLNDVTCAIMMRLKRLTPLLKKASPLFLCLTILVIYAGIHVLIAWRTPAYQFFASSQICGVFVYLMWQLTGTILI